MRLLRYLIFTGLCLAISPAWAQQDTTKPAGDSPSDLTSQIRQLEDEINREYFEDARAKNYAIACARYAEEAYFYAKDIHQGYNLNRTYLSKARANADTSYWFVKKAILVGDSALLVASDTSHLAIDYMTRALNHLNTAKAQLEALYTTNDIGTTRFHGQRAMFENSHGLVDAYHASLLFGDGGLNPDDPTEINEAVTRTEADEATFEALTFMYEQRISQLEDDLKELARLIEETVQASERARLEERLAELEEEKALLESKLSNAREQLGKIENELAIQERIAANENGNGDGNGSDGNGDNASANGSDNNESDIPMNVELPKGLVYRVQVGYYPRNKRVRFDLDKIDGVRKGSYIRYFAGFYKTYQEATAAKNQIRSGEIDDAFLVAFLDGMKISVYEALQHEKAQEAEE